MRSRGRLECEESGVLLRRTPQEEAVEPEVNANRSNESMEESALDPVSRNGTRWTLPLGSSTATGLNFFSFKKPLG